MADKYTPISQIDSSLFSYNVNKNSKKVFEDVCDYCHKPFTFTTKDVKDRMIRCPHCNAEIVYFAYEYN